MEARPQLHLSTPAELLVPLRWIAILHGRTNASLAATGGIHDAAGLAKALLAGADVGMIASASAGDSDPSHGTGRWYLVEPMSMASVAAGADGLMIEMPPEPGQSPLRRCPKP